MKEVSFSLNSNLNPLAHLIGNQLDQNLLQLLHQQKELNARISELNQSKYNNAFHNSKRNFSWNFVDIFYTIWLN